MKRHAIDLTAFHERASATPSRTRAETRAPVGVPRKVSSPGPEPATLQDVQEWFAGSMMDERIPAADAVAAARLTAGARLSAADRLDIYRRGYRARLVECLADDYPVLAEALGSEAFEEVCVAYIAFHPSGSPSLNYFGRSMEAFLRAEGSVPPPLRGFAADMAALEWAIVEVIHAPSADPLTMDQIARVPANGWEDARLVPNTAFRLRRYDHPVNSFFQDLRDGKAPSIPGPADSATVIYRSGPTIWRMDLTPPMFEVLHALVGGEPLGRALGRAEGLLVGEDPSAIADRVGSWFREWVSSGLFVSVER